MNKIQALLTTTVLLFGISGSSFADYDDGVVAAGKGDYKTAFNEWKPLAEQGHVKAQIRLAQMYRMGKGVLKDYKESFKWRRKAAEQGNASAQLFVGTKYASGEGVSKDLSKARYWTKKAYENPDASASTRDLAEDYWNLLELWKY